MDDRPPTVDADRLLRHALLDQAIAAIDEKLALATAAIVEHPQFQTLFGAWLGLWRLAESAEDAPGGVIELLNLGKDDLIQDFDEYLDLSDSALFFHLYKSEYDQAGGAPYAAMLLHYEFANTPADVSLLRQLSMVASSCHCPVIANAAPALFGLRRFDQVEQIKDFKLLFQGQEYAKWRQLCAGEDSRYLGIALPRLRVAWRRKRLPPRFCGHPALAEADRAWCCASYAFGMALIRSYARHGWCVYIRGPRTGGLIPELECFPFGGPGYELDQPPVEICLSDRQEQEAAALGFIPLVYFREARRLCVFSAPSIQALAAETGQVPPAEVDRLAASLPYLFLVSRIAHYQKIIQRENLGTVKESRQLDRELTAWLKKLITRMPDPDMSQRSRYPLRDGRVSVREDPAAPGFFTVRLDVLPHLQLEGVNAQLTLISKMPRKE